MTGFGFNVSGFGAFTSREVFVEATGGTITTDGDFKVHTFTSSSDFVVTNTSGPLFPITYLMVAGGGSGGAKSTTDMIQGGGGGAGGLLTGTQTLDIDTTYSVVIGAGAAYATSTSNPTNGANTTFSGFTALGGGRGGSGIADQPSNGLQAVDGGSGEKDLGRATYWLLAGLVLAHQGKEIMAVIVTELVELGQIGFLLRLVAAAVLAGSAKTLQTPVRAA